VYAANKRNKITSMKKILPIILYSALGLLLGVAIAWFLAEISGTTGPFADEAWMNSILLAPAGLILGGIIGYGRR